MTVRSPRFPAFPPTSGELIRWCAERFDDKTFAVLGDERLTYADAEVRSAQIAQGLLASGAGKGTRVGLLARTAPSGSSAGWGSRASARSRSC